MKTWSLLALLLSTGALAQESFFSPIEMDLMSPEDERLIEPTSPILGHSLVTKIRQDSRHPELILQDLKTNPNIKRDLQLSSMAYFKTLVGPLKNYCATEQKEAPDDKAIPVVEMAAIPLHILKPLHPAYKKNLAKLRTNYVELHEGDAEAAALATALAYQQERYNCPVVTKLTTMEAKIKKYLPKRLDRLVDLHGKISSPEAPFPRVQFSVNGFTQYVYNEIFKIEHDRLSRLLKVIYEAQVEWLKNADEGKISNRYFAHFNDKAIQAGYQPREILLVLAYSTRNMPSLDVQYGYDADKALMLETYFWKFHDHRDYATKKYVKDVFPNRVFKTNPGLYHFATSALMACEVRLHGYSGVMARLIALGNKVGYKVHKLFTELAGKKQGEGKKKEKGLKNIIATAKRQGFGPGVDAGKYGGKYGLRLCRKFTAKKDYLKNRPESAPAELVSEDSELEAEDFSEEVEEAL